jgi:hypothetical protein
VNLTCRLTEYLFLIGMLVCRRIGVHIGAIFRGCGGFSGCVDLQRLLDHIVVIIARAPSPP